MFFAVVVLVSLLVAVARGQPVGAIADRPFRLMPLAILGAVLRLAISISPAVRPLATLLALNVPGTTVPIGDVLYPASLAYLAVFLAGNVARPGFAVLLVGMAANLVVIALNGGQMPGDPVQLAAAGLLADGQAGGLAGHWTTAAPLGPATRLPWLGDMFLVPLPFHAPVVLSPGDLALAVGCFWSVNQPLPRRSSRHRWNVPVL